MSRPVFLPAILLLLLAPAYAQSGDILRPSDEIKINATHATGGAAQAENRVLPQSTSTTSLGSRALLRAEGKSIKINGAAAPTVTTIFSGDRIETGADTAASLVYAGRILTLDRNSAAIFRNGTLVPSRGKAWSSSQNSSAPATVTKLVAPAPVTTSSTTAVTATSTTTTQLATAETPVQGDAGSSNDHFNGICAQFPVACDQAEDACEKRTHHECVCTYQSDHDKDDISPIPPRCRRFQVSPGGQSVPEQ
jgi:hypothetical protein